MSDSVRPHRRKPTRLPRPWDSPGKNTGMGFYCLLRNSSGGNVKWSDIRYILKAEYLPEFYLLFQLPYKHAILEPVKATGSTCQVFHSHVFEHTLSLWLDTACLNYYSRVKNLQKYLFFCKVFLHSLCISTALCTISTIIFIASETSNFLNACLHQQILGSSGA